MKLFISLVFIIGLVGCGSSPVYKAPIQKPVTLVEPQQQTTEPVLPSKSDLDKRKKRLELIQKATEGS